MKRRLGSALKLLVAAALFAYVIRRHDLSAAYVGILARNPLFWGIALLGHLLVHALATLRWQILLGRQGAGLSFLRCLLYHSAGQFLGLVAFGTLGTDL